jgi:hypothetical protein
MLRGALRRARPRVAAAPPRAVVAPALSATAARPAGPRPWLARMARRALYTGPALRLLGHMLLVVARRA